MKIALIRRQEQPLSPLSTRREKESASSTTGETDTKGKSLADPKSLHPPILHPEVLPGSGVRVKVGKGVRRITLVRAIISGLICDWETATFPELLVLFDSLLWCQNKSSRDPDFQKKFGQFLEKTSLVFKKNRFSEKNFIPILRRIVLQLKEAGEGHLIPKRNLAGVNRHFQGKLRVIPTHSLGTRNSELPPVRFIGIGYKDKGARRDPAWDGSPRWQEVATFIQQVEGTE